MSTKKMYYNKKKTLRRKIHKYIYKKKDICCAENVDRKIAIDQILNLYIENTKMINEKDDYLAYVVNDTALFIGNKIDLEKEKDVEGLKLWKEINSETFKNKKLNKENVISFLNRVPLYYLLSFLGYAYYRYKTTKTTKTKIGNK